MGVSVGMCSESIGCWLVTTSSCIMYKQAEREFSSFVPVASFSIHQSMGGFHANRRLLDRNARDSIMLGVHAERETVTKLYSRL